MAELPAAIGFTQIDKLREFQNVEKKIINPGKSFNEIEEWILGTDQKIMSGLIITW